MNRSPWCFMPLRLVSLLLVILLSISSASADAPKKSGKGKAVTATFNSGSAAGGKSSRMMSVTYAKSGDETSQSVADLLKEGRVFEEFADGIEETLRLKHPLVVRFEDCGAVNAYYDPGEYRISICYELITQYMKIFASQSDLTEEQIGLHVIHATVFSFFHELGHALIHNLDIPVTGKEEDAVDDLATIILIEAGEDGVAAVFSAILQFAASADEVETKLETLAFWDEHSLDSQRVYSQACLVYGSDPKKHSDLAGEDFLPVARAERCPEEYQQKYKSWNRLLEPHYK